MSTSSEATAASASPRRPLPPRAPIPVFPPPSSTHLSSSVGEMRISAPPQYAHHLPTANASSSSTPLSAPEDTLIPPPPAYITPTSAVYMEDGRESKEEVPMYEEKVVSEPETLARTLWVWGWLFFPLWVLGAILLWVEPLQDEDEADPTKRQRETERIAIIRVVEKKYARRCMWSLIGLTVMVGMVVGIAILARRPS